MGHAEFIFINHLSGILLFVTAFLFLKFPPKNINGLYGYRTLSSMKDQSSWDLAQKVSANYLLKGSLILISWQLLSYLFIYFMMPQWKEFATVLNVLAIVPVLIIAIFKTEKALRKNNFKGK
jgi:uncharacterized membrane protein